MVKLKHLKGKFPEKLTLTKSKEWNNLAEGYNKGQEIYAELEVGVDLFKLAHIISGLDGVGGYTARDYDLAKAISASLKEILVIGENTE